MRFLDCIFMEQVESHSYLILGLANFISEDHCVNLILSNVEVGFPGIPRVLHPNQSPLENRDGDHKAQET